MVKGFLPLMLFAFFVLRCNMAEKQENETATTTKKKLTEKEGDNTTTEKQTPLTNQYIETNSEAEILNNIIVHESGGLKIARAFLSFEDGTLVPRTNRTELGKAVYLHLLVESGWKHTNRKAYIDASEKIVTDGGEVVLDANNLFKDIPAMDATDANTSYLEATITKTRRDINYFIVSFRVWDKLGLGEVRGSYKLYVDEKAE